MKEKIHTTNGQLSTWFASDYLGCIKLWEHGYKIHLPALSVSASACGYQIHVKKPSITLLEPSSLDD